MYIGICFFPHCFCSYILDMETIKRVCCCSSRSTSSTGESDSDRLCTSSNHRHRSLPVYNAMTIQVPVFTSIEFSHHLLVLLSMGPF